MPITDADIRHYRAQYHPYDDTSQVGGPRSSLIITGTGSGEVIPDGSVVLVGEVVLYYKTFVRNEHSSLTLMSPRVWLANALPDDLPSSGAARLVASAQDAGKVVRLLGLTQGGNVATESITLSNGAVDSTTVWSQLWRVELVNASAAQPIQIRHAPTDGLLGVIPAGSRSATAEVDIGAAATPDDSGTSQNRRTPPPGITFSRPSSPDQGLSIADLSPGASWGIWRRYRFRSGAVPPVLPGLYVELRVTGVST